MAEARALYQEMILDHNKSPRNFFKLENANRSADGHNPLCGDRLSVFSLVENGKVIDASFVGNGCAISKASASLMTAAVKGKTVEEVAALTAVFLNMVTGETVDESVLGKLVVFNGVCEFPVRVKCASLAWRTLEAALRNKEALISTE
jgi:nitrogen fixation NifU-like protein